MCKHLMLGSVLMVGTGLTTVCASSGLARLSAIASNPNRTAGSHGEMKTVLIRVENVDVEEAATVLRRVKTNRGEIGVNRPEQLVRITDLPWNVARLKRVLREIDSPPCGCDRAVFSDQLRGEQEAGPVELPIGPPAAADATDRASGS